MLGPAMDGGGPVAPAEDAADGDDDDIDHQVLAIARVPRIGERFEVGAEGADVDELGHGNHPGSGAWGPWRRTTIGSDPGTRIGTKISPRGPSRQTTQTSQLYARAVGSDACPLLVGEFVAAHGRTRLGGRPVCSWGFPI